MSADLLRRAAKNLRDRAEAASAGDWVAATNTGRKDGISLVGRSEERGTGRAIAVFADTRVSQRAADAKYAALMHPPVALALAGVLDNLAAAIDNVVGDAAAANIFESELALCRAILREESS